MTSFGSSVKDKYNILQDINGKDNLLGENEY